MREEAIPLFVDEDDSRDDSEGYQLHPHYAWMEDRKTATEPDNELCRLSINSNTLKDPNLVIGLGRLFASFRNAKAARTCKRTGYEVSVNKELASWMVFDRHSNNLRAEDWYPIPCRLSHTTLQDYSEEQRVMSYISKERRFDIACFLPSLRDLSNADFKTASEKVQEGNRCGDMRVCEVERKEIDKLLETDLALQGVSVDKSQPAA